MKTILFCIFVTFNAYAFQYPIQIEPIRTIQIENNSNLDQWAFENTGKPDSRGRNGKIGADLHIKNLWNKNYNGSKSIIVAMIDTGLDINHESLKDNIYTNQYEIPNNGIDDDHNGYIDDLHGWNFSELDPVKNPNGNNDVKDEYNHGTHVAGIIGANGKNNFGIRGVNLEVQLLPIRFTNATGGGSIESAIAAVKYAILMKADVINCSWGMVEDSKQLHDAFLEASQNGILIVVSAGNSSVDIGKNAIYPAAYTDIPNLISVAASDNEDELAFFSNFSENKVHVTAPGYSIASTLVNNDYGILSGTSMSAPMVSGLAALLKAHLSLGASEIKKRIVDTSDPKIHLYFKSISHGRINAEAAFNNTVPTPIYVPREQDWKKASLSKIYESSHPYVSNANQVYKINVPGAKLIRVLFEYIETESNTDFVKIENAMGQIIENYSGFLNYKMSEYVSGDSISIRLTSDQELNARGFKVSEVQFIE